MGCACGTKKDGKVSGCNNNGACNTGGCNKMNVFDWLSNMDMPVKDRFAVVEVRFKNGRKDFYRNTDGLASNNGRCHNYRSSYRPSFGACVVAR
jgi:hypothetical protein